MEKTEDLSHQITASPLARVSAVREAGKWTLTFTREFAHSPEKLWEMLTDPKHLKCWLPLEANRNLGAVGPVTLTMTDQDEPKELQDDVYAVERPRLLEFTWGKDLLRWELTPSATGTRITLKHTVDSEDWLPRVAAGWHICLFVAERLAARTPVRRIVGMGAMDYGWPELHDAYAALLGLAGGDGVAWAKEHLKCEKETPEADKT